jgi:uncharacterized membrane protein YhaH (DUF805 family)
VSDTWYYADQNKQVGPLDIQQLKATLLRLSNARDVLVWRPGFTDWRKAGDVPELSVDASAPPPPFADRPAPFATAGATPAPQPTLVELFFSFSGRTNRAKYWGISIINGVITGLSIVAALAINSALTWVFFGLVVLASIVSAISLGARRLHDRDKSALWLLCYYLVPWFLSAVGALSGNTGLNALLSFASLGVSIWAFVDLACLKGTTGDNRFGPDPLAGRI